MENVIPKYKRPIKGIYDPTVKVEHWVESLDAFDEKKYKNSVIELLNYINPELLKDKKVDGDFEVIQMQGSAEIHVKVTDTTFTVRAPFLKITNNTNKVALLRKVAEVNFTPLKLAQITQHNEELWFEYEMPLSVCQPNKVYDLLLEVCVNADDYDDEFIENYNASFYKESQHKQLTDSEKEEVWSQISGVFEDYKNYTQFFKDKRWEDYIWDIIVISLLKLSNMPYLQGKLRSDLIEYIGNLFNGNLDFKYRVDKGVNFMKKLTAKSKDEIMKDVYHAEQFISLRWRSSEEIISERLKNNMEQVQKYEKDQSNFNLSYYLQFILLKLAYDYNLEEDYRNVIETALEKVSGLDPNDAAPILSKAFYDLQSGKIHQTEKVEKKGFFSKLFS